MDYITQTTGGYIITYWDEETKSWKFKYVSPFYLKTEVT